MAYISQKLSLHYGSSCGPVGLHPQSDRHYSGKRWKGTCSRDTPKSTVPDKVPSRINMLSSTLTTCLNYYRLRLGAEILLIWYIKIPPLIIIKWVAELCGALVQTIPQMMPVDRGTTPKACGYGQFAVCMSAECQQSDT